MDDMRMAFCPFCGKHLIRLTPFCGFCGRSLAFLIAAAQTEEPAVPGTSGDGPDLLQQCINSYTDLYAPDVEDMDEDLVAVDVGNLQHTAVEEMSITLPDIVANLSLPIDHKRVSRFNISRANVWDGAVRGFKRKTYTENCDMLVRFVDDVGLFEEGIDTGGPRREFFTLLMRHLKDRPIFDGPDGHRFVVYNAKAVREDEYFMAGKMIAVSVVHGGPGPHFLSEDLVQYLAGRPSFKSTVNAITDEEIRTVLREIENAASLDALQECTMRHSSVLQTAGCLRRVTSVEEKKDIVADYIRWYVIDRNSSVIDRWPFSPPVSDSTAATPFFADPSSVPL